MAKTKSNVPRKVPRPKVAKSASCKSLPITHWAYTMGMITAKENAAPQQSKK